MHTPSPQTIHIMLTNNDWFLNNKLNHAHTENIAQSLSFIEK